MENLSIIQKIRIAVQIKNILKELPKDVKKFIFINPEYSRDENNNKFLKLIGKKSKITVSTDYYGGNGIGNINISEHISLYFDDSEHKILYGNNYENKNIRRLNFQVSDNLKNKTEQFEKDNIKLSGSSKTLFGEIFRALQYIQYRAHNDGDKPWDINSPTFISQLYILHKISILNNVNYNYDLLKSGLKFNDEELIKLTWNDEHIIVDNFEHSLADDVQLTKYQLIDLIESNQLIDEENDFDSRLGKKLNNG